MKEQEKKLDVLRKIIFLYITEIYSDDNFLVSLINQYDELNKKLIPIYEMAEKSKKIMDKIIKDVKPSEDSNYLQVKNKKFAEELLKDFANDSEEFLKEDELKENQTNRIREILKDIPKEDISEIWLNKKPEENKKEQSVE